MLVDKLCTIVDIGLGYMNTQQDNNLPDELRERITVTSQSITEELNFMLDWISHPIGSNIMKNDNKNLQLTKKGTQKCLMLQNLKKTKRRKLMN